MSFELSELEPRLEQSRRAEEKARALAEEYDRKSRSIGHLRGLTFLLFLFALGSAFMSSAQVVRVGAGVGAAVTFFGFLWLIRKHDGYLAEMQRAEREAKVHAAHQNRTRGAFAGLEDTGEDLTPADHPYAADLDLFGQGSLFQRTSTAHTHFGREKLARWLTEPAAAETVRERQAAVAELARLEPFRVLLETEARALVQIKQRGKAKSRETPDPSALLRWIEEPGGLPTGPAYRLLCTIIPVGTTLGLTASVLFDAAPFYWLTPLMIGLFLLARAKDVTGPTFGVVSQTEGSFLPYADLLVILERLDAKAPLTRQLLDELRSAGSEGNKASLVASQEMQRFRNLVSWYDIRHNGMVYPFIEAMLLWSIHSTLRLERWKRAIGARARRWFEIVAEMEALCSLAELLQCDPMATLPSLAEASAPLEAVGLGHPLIPAPHRKANDLPSLAAGHGLLVTGSNMSGKSTFLRALGVNTVLALAGGPVTARRFTLPPLVIRTSLRVDDSLLSGTSHFFAEVKKLALVVESARKGPQVLFLLDEVLHGTNSRERVIGARWVLAELLAHGAFGIMTTHDEGLTSLEEALIEKVALFHFREDVTDGKMTFDYTLRPGPVRSGNALRLMRSVGLDVPLNEPKS